jgi:hypothetical protein
VQLGAGAVTELVGQRFGRLIVVDGADAVKGRKAAKCVCDCGSHHVVAIIQLKRGRSRSCGCFRRERSRAQGLSTRKHGHSVGYKGDKVYRAWQRMKERCLNPSHHAYADYGGRGITVCERWLESFENFLADMGEPLAGQSLDRIDNNLLIDSYSKGNCRWATPVMQARNRRKPRRRSPA